MPRYRIHRMKDVPRENFRWAAHTAGLAVVKLRDYDSSGEVDAVTPYAAWKFLATESRPLRSGDLLEAIRDDGEPGQLHIAKYVGFEPAQWYVPEPQLQSGSAPLEVASPSDSHSA